MTVIIGGGAISEAIRSLKRCTIIKEKDFGLIEMKLREISDNVEITEIIVTTGYLEKSTVGEYSFRNIEQTVSANFLTPILIANLSINLYPTAKLIFFSSSVSFEPRKGYGAYSASKTALEIFLRTAMVENPEVSIKIIRNARTDTKLRWNNYPQSTENKRNLLSPLEVAIETMKFTKQHGSVLEIYKRNEIIHTDIWDER